MSNTKTHNSKAVTKIKGAFLENVMSKSFDQLFNEKDEDIKKETLYVQNKKGKQVQLLARINNIQMQITKSEINYRKSLVDPTMDSIDLAIEIKASMEELKIAMEVYKQLFPKAPMPA